MMYLSHPKTPLKPTKSALPVFGSITRSPRTPPSSSLYSESDGGVGTQGGYYSDTFMSESAFQGGDQQQKKTPRKSQISFKENDITETIHTEIPFTGRSTTDIPFTGRTVKSLTERAITEIETCISEYDQSEKIVTVTEKLPSLSETKSSQSLYSNTFESDSQFIDNKSSLRPSKSDQESTVYDYSDTFHSTGHSERDTTAHEFDESDYTLNEDSMTQSSTFKSLEETVASASPTPESYSVTFEADSESEREYIADFEESTSLKTDYTDTFLSLGSVEDSSEKIRQAEELKKISQEAEEEFIAAMVTHIKQKPMRDSDISALIDKELEGPDYEELDKHSKRYMKKKIRLLKQKLNRGEDQRPQEVTNQWECKKNHLISDYGVHPAILDKLKLHNFIHDMEKAAQTKIHDPITCRECRVHQLSLDAAAAERNFIRLKTREVRQREMEDNYHNYLVRMDSINLIADIARSLPRATEDPETIEDQLFKGLNLSRAISKNRLSAS
ncbi:uncharacterized protein LOC133173791 [Saccostrea echinata]|uniref:uncharacterized protein LOC133173791 n=1 Tax=Saccostrea echinata TaxID=191078 RepID=UPI002A82DF99|nr:uncharacterized protein LOC133173791 [Saccostrea echinata]